MYVLWAASRKAKEIYVIGSTPQQSLFRENCTLSGNSVTNLPLHNPHNASHQKCILHFTSALSMLTNFAILSLFAFIPISISPILRHLIPL